MKHTSGSVLDEPQGWLGLFGVYLLAVIVLAFSAGFFSCASVPTLEQAKTGMRLACDALAVAIANGRQIPAPELAERVCDVERTAAVMTGIVERTEGLRQIVTDPDWFDLQPSLVHDAGAQ